MIKRGPRMAPGKVRRGELRYLPSINIIVLSLLLIFHFVL